MVATCHIFLCNHIREAPSGSAHPTYTEALVRTVCVCACARALWTIFTSSTQVKRNNYMFIFFPIWSCFNYFLNCIFHLSAMFTLITDHSPVFISPCQKGLAGYLWLQAIRTLSKPVFINYCFNSWLISAAEIQGGLYLKSSSTISKGNFLVHQQLR